MPIFTDTMNGTEAQKTILHHVYAYKGLNSPKVQDSVAEGRSAEAVLQSSTATGPERPLSGLRYPLPPDSGSVTAAAVT